MHTETVNMHEAKTNLSKLIDQISTQGGSFIIAKAGKPVARVTAIEPKPRTGMLQDICEIPENFDSLMADEIESLFSGSEP